MNKKDFLFLTCIVVFVTCIFFAKVLFQHQVPFPGGLLADTPPFNTESYLGYAPGGFPNKAQGRDVIAQLLPWKYFSIQQLKQHHVPLWNPYNFSGNAHIGDYQTGVFYPFNVVFFLFSFPVAWSIFIMLQPILGLVFMYFLLKDMRLNTLAALLGAVGFGFSSYMVVWFEWGNIGHTMLWLPLLLLATRKFLQTRRVLFAVILTSAGIFSLLAGYIQGAFYVLAVTYLYGIMCFFRGEHKRKHGFIFFTLCFVGMGMGAAIQIVPTVFVFLESTRGVYTQSQIQNLLQPWYYLVTIFSSEFFGNPATRNYYLPITYFERVMYPGISFLFFAGYALTKVKNFEIKFFMILAGITVILTTNLPGVSWLYAIPLPLISTTVPTRLLSIFIFSVVLLGSFGIDYWISKKDIKSVAPVIFLSIYFLLWIGLFVASKIYPTWSADILITKHNLILATFFAVSTLVVFFLRIKSVRLSSILLICIVFADLFYVFTKFTPFASSELLFPKTPVIEYLQAHQSIARSWSYGNAYIPANYQTALGIYGADGYDPLFSKYYATLLNSSGTGKIQLPLSRTDANIAPGYGTESLKTNSYRQKILDVLGVKYVLNIREGNSIASDNDTFPPNTYKLVWNKNPWQIYENLSALPRYFLVNKYQSVKDNNEIGTFYRIDTAHTVLLSTNATLPVDPNATGVVRMLSYQPNTVRFTTTTSGNMVLFLSDTYASGWRATIDGVVVPIYRADVAFRAVVVPKGKHQVTFSYEPASFNIGLVITVLSLVIGSSFLFIRKIL